MTSKAERGGSRDALSTTEAGPPPLYHHAKVPSFPASLVLNLKLRVDPAFALIQSFSGCFRIADYPGATDFHHPTSIRLLPLFRCA
jgi:hypothetical protein